MTYTVGLLHPGSMGSAFGAQLRARGHTVLWCPDGRSNTSRHRAEQAGLEPKALPELISRSDVLLSLCPPAAAEEVAAQVATPGIVGTATIYVEANAVAPPRVQRIADRLAPMPVLDAAVVGSPPVGGKTPTLYLSGPGKQADRIAHRTGLATAHPLSPRRAVRVDVQDSLPARRPSRVRPGCSPRGGSAALPAAPVRDGLAGARRGPQRAEGRPVPSADRTGQPRSPGPAHDNAPGPRHRVRPDRGELPSDESVHPLRTGRPRLRVGGTPFRDGRRWSMPGWMQIRLIDVPFVEPLIEALRQDTTGENGTSSHRPWFSHKESEGPSVP
jgi:hypothetical protein